MPIGELFLSAFLSVLFEKLASSELWQFLRQEGLYSKIKKWETILIMIQAVLGDAEERQLTDRAVKTWLDDLRDLAYDVEDMLDEFATEALSRKLKMKEHEHHASTSSCVFLPVCLGNWSPRAIKFNRGMESAIKDVTNRLEGLCQLREGLGLRENAGAVSSSTAAVYQRPPTTSLPTEPAVYGRDQDKAKVIEMVLKDEPSDANFRVIPIVGMGGIGKTTLAREVYNDNELKGFESRAWVCIYEDFDVLRISNAILGSMTLSPCDYKDLNIVQIKLKEVVTGKKFLLVLDDVWSKDYRLWETLKSPFMSVAQGSKILVTTRLTEVALMMNPGKFYELKLLSDGDCWSLFMRHAFECRDIATYRNIKLIRQKVVEKCKGLPLAAKTLGGLLRCKRGEDEWLNILNSKLWELFDETEIPTALKLSYYHLPAQLKRCFAYCAVLPKDYEFEEKELVHLWMAEGLLQKPNESKQPEDLGNEYFHDLLLRSLFQNSSMKKYRYILHDLISDLAQWASGKTCFNLDEEARANKQPINLEKVRHFSYSYCEYDRKSQLEVFGKVDKVEHLRTFLPLSKTIYPSGLFCSYMSPTVLFDLLSKFKRLRVLTLKKYYITELPESLGCLRYIRYLNLSSTKIRNLPESTSSFVNLQILKLRNCSRLTKLPCKMRNWINLCHLDIKGTRLTEMPLQMRDLKYLQTLTNFIVGKSSGAEVKDLKHFKFLRGELCISRLENVMYSQGTKEMILKDMKDVKVLQLEWGSQFDGMQNEVIERSVLDMLQPHRNLEELTIKCYNGIEFPSWLGNSVLSNMTVLRLEYCEKYTSLPSLGALCSLKELTIKGMKGLKCIGYELYGDDCSKPFQLLETLCFEDLQEWELWKPVKENEHVETFPGLRKLSILKCPKLSGRMPNDLPSLEELVIRECGQLVVSFSSIPVLCKFEVDGCKEIACNREVDFKSVTSLSLANISEYGNWFREEFQNDICLEKAPQRLQSFTFLTKLCIKNCSNLVSFHEVCFLSNLTKLEIRNCSALTSLLEGMKHNNARLEHLIIEQCNSLKFIIKGLPPPSLRLLQVAYCEQLGCLLDDKEESCASSMLLKENVCSPEIVKVNPTGFLSFCISGCSKLTALSSSGQLPRRLRSLLIFSASKLESIAEKFHDNMYLECIGVTGCDNLKYIPEGLHTLSRLLDITVQFCPNLVCFPEGGLPITNLSVSINCCEKLEALPDGFHKLDSLRVLHVSRCSSIKSFTEEGFPTNLTSLSIGDHNMYKALLEWGLHKLTSLTYLSIVDCSDAEIFPEEELGMQLLPTLIHLTIEKFPKLKYLSSKDFQNLTCLESLQIISCPNLTSFPKEGLPSSLLNLDIRGCPLLKEKCKRNKGKEWSKISHIPCVEIDYRFIYDPEEDGFIYDPEEDGFIYDFEKDGFIYEPEEDD